MDACGIEHAEREIDTHQCARGIAVTVEQAKITGVQLVQLQGFHGCGPDHRGVGARVQQHFFRLAVQGSRGTRRRLPSGVAGSELISARVAQSSAADAGTCESAGKKEQRDWRKDTHRSLLPSEGKLIA